MDQPLLTVSQLGKTFRRDKDQTVLQAVRDVSFTLQPGEILGIVGESGCGKSTLARCVIRLETPTQGSVVFQGQELTGKSERAMAPIRPKMQMVFQNPYSSFNPKLTIGHALRSVARFHRIEPGAFQTRLEELLATTGLEREWMDRRPIELSGGQLQRFAIVRALLTGPDLLIADEAVSALDVSVQAQILNLLSDLREKLGLAILFISHDLSVVRHLCDRVLVMYLGSVMELGQREAVLERAAHPYTQALIAARPRLHPDSTARQQLLQGDAETLREAGESCPFAPRCSRAQQRCRQAWPPLYEIEAQHQAACYFSEPKRSE